MKNLKDIPAFDTLEAEQEFWENNDSADYIDWSKAQKVSFANLKPSTKTISLRLPENLLERIKIEANKRDMPYQSLIKFWLMESAKA